MKLTIKKKREDLTTRGPKGEQGDSAFEVWLDEHDGEGTFEQWLEEIRGPRGRAGEPGEKGRPGPRGPAGFGSRGPAGPQGPAADTTPKSTTIVRDADGRIQSAAVEGGPTWTLARNEDLSVASLTDSSATLVDVDRDVDGIVTGTTVTEL